MDEEMQREYQMQMMAQMPAQEMIASITFLEDAKVDIFKIDVDMGDSENFTVYFGPKAK